MDARQDALLAELKAINNRIRDLQAEVREIRDKLEEISPTSITLGKRPSRKQ